MLRPAARHQLLQLSNLPDRSGGFVREKARFSFSFFPEKRNNPDASGRGSKNSLLICFSNQSF
jgi:hypothetical protein